MEHILYSKFDFLISGELDSGVNAGISLVRLKKMPIHMHSNMQLVYMLDGEMDIKISFQSYRLKAGDMLIINAYEMHAAKSIDEDCIFLLMHLEEDFYQLSQQLFVFDPDFYREQQLLHVTRVKQLMVQFFHQKNNKSPDASELIASCWEIADICKNFFQLHHFDVINRKTNYLTASHSKSKKIEQICKYIYQEFKQPLMLNCAAQKLFISKYYLAHLVKESTGASFQDNLNAVRVDRSELLLLGTNMSIEEIAFAVNFSSTSYYTRQFKKYFKLTPAAYRRANISHVYPQSPIEQNFISYENESLLVKQLTAGLPAPTPNNSYTTLQDDEKEIVETIFKQLNKAGLIKTKFSKIKRIIVHHE